MTAVQHAKSSARRASLRVVKGRKFNGRPRLTPWLAFTLVVVVALFGIVVTQTSLDRGAFELAEPNRSIAQAETDNQHLRLEVARLESPARVAPLATEMGLVYPDTRRTVMVAGVVEQVAAGDPRWASITDFATEEVSP